MCSAKEYKDPMTDYEKYNMPKDLPTGDTSAGKKAIIDQKFQLYVAKEEEIKDNICKMYKMFWGEFTDALQSIIAHEKGYEETE